MVFLAVFGRVTKASPPGHAAFPPERVAICTPGAQRSWHLRDLFDEIRCGVMGFPEPRDSSVEVFTSPEKEFEYVGGAAGFRMQARQHHDLAR